MAYNYNYGYDPVQANYQQRLAEMQRQQLAAQYPPPANIQPMPKVRIVTSIEEAKAAQVDLDGTPTFFRSPAEGKIYEKSIGLDGLPVFNVYQREAATPQVDSLQTLAARVTKLENQLKGAASYESNAVTTTNGTSAVQQ